MRCSTRIGAQIGAGHGWFISSNCSPEVAQEGCLDTLALGLGPCLYNAHVDWIVSGIGFVQNSSYVFDVAMVPSHISPLQQQLYHQISVQNSIKTLTEIVPSDIGTEQHLNFDSNGTIGAERDSSIGAGGFA